MTIEIGHQPGADTTGYDWVLLEDGGIVDRFESYHAAFRAQRDYGISFPPITHWTFVPDDDGENVLVNIGVVGEDPLRFTFRTDLLMSLVKSIATAHGEATEVVE